MTEQAQKIWEAFCGELIQEPTDDMREALATAIRAVVEPFHWTWNAEMCHKHLVTIANELEGK